MCLRAFVSGSIQNARLSFSTSAAPSAMLFASAGTAAAFQPASFNDARYAATSAACAVATDGQRPDGAAIHFSNQPASRRPPMLSKFGGSSESSGIASLGNRPRGWWQRMHCAAAKTSRPARTFAHDSTSAPGSTRNAEAGTGSVRNCGLLHISRTRPSPFFPLR